MKRYAVGLDSVVYLFCQAHDPSQPWRIFARYVFASSPR